MMWRRAPLHRCAARGLVLALVCFSLPAALRFAGAESPAPERAGAWKIFAECRLVVLPQKIALPMISGLKDPATHDATWDRLGQLIEQGKIELSADLVVQGLAGQPLVAETHEEMRYGAEYQPPQIPDRLPPKAAPDALKDWTLVGASITAFEVRNVGADLQIKADVSPDGSWLALSSVVQHTRFAGWRKIPFAEMPWGERLSLDQPLFDELKNESAFRLRNGEKILLGVHKLPEPEKTFELFLLQVKASPAGPSRKK